MAGGPSAGRRSGRRRRRERSPHDRAVAKYTVAAKSLNRLVKSAGTAATEWSRTVDLAIDEIGRDAAARMLASSVDRKDAAEDLLRICCPDGEGRLEMVPGIWRADIAVVAEGMASLANRAAALWSANGAMTNTATARVVLAELSASDAWMDFAARVEAAERAAAGTALEASPAAERSAAAARRIAAGSGEKMAAMRREAAAVWEEASALWLRVREEASRESDAATVRMATVKAKATDEHAARLRAA